MENVESKEDLGIDAWYRFWDVLSLSEEGFAPGKNAMLALNIQKQ